jgi:hypothetical protein
MDSQPDPEWLAACAHGLQRHWRTVEPDFLQEVARDLWRNEKLRTMPPLEAAQKWLEPVTFVEGE